VQLLVEPLLSKTPQLLLLPQPQLICAQPSEGEKKASVSTCVIPLESQSLLQRKVSKTGLRALCALKPVPVFDFVP
jgi:hypothetical protein